MDKVMIVVGMGSGISAAVARRFAREGFAVGAVARQAGKLDEQLAALRASSVTVAGATADAGDIGSLRQALARLQRELGDASVLVYNAAGMSYQPLAQLQAEQFASDLSVSVVGAFTAAQFVLPAMRVRVGQRVASNRRAKPEVIQPMTLRRQARLDIAQQLSKRQLRESHRIELIQTREALDRVLAVVARHTAPERRQRQMRHDLRENELALTHRHPKRDHPAMGRKSAARRSNRDQAQTAICLVRSSTYQRLG